jgi:Mg-chelatase subunit ChlI
MQGKGRMPSPATAIALVALFAALGGTAVALDGRNSVRSDDIKNGQVRKPDIRKRAVDASRTDLTKVKAKAGEATTTSNSPVALGW